jgi:hypothetical protein
VSCTARSEYLNIIYMDLRLERIKARDVIRTVFSVRDPC